LKHYAFVDESGTEDPFSRQDHFLVVALVSTSYLRDIELPMTRMYKKYGTGLRTGEIKASTSSHEIKTRVLEQLMTTPVQIIATVIDKRCIKRPPATRNAADVIYHEAIAGVIGSAVLRTPDLDVCLDKHYTAPRKRQALEAAIQKRIASLCPNPVPIQHGDSQSHRGLQVADFVAWSFFQKYEKGDCRYWHIIEANVVEETVIVRELW
jgi:hypothetical protein